MERCDRRQGYLDTGKLEWWCVAQLKCAAGCQAVTLRGWRASGISVSECGSARHGAPPQHTRARRDLRRELRRSPPTHESAVRDAGNGDRAMRTHRRTKYSASLYRSKALTYLNLVNTVLKKGAGYTCLVMKVPVACLVLHSGVLTEQVK